MISRRSGAFIPCARASMDRSSGASSAADPPHARRNERRLELVGAHFVPPVRARRNRAIATLLNSDVIVPFVCARRSLTSQVL